MKKTPELSDVLYAAVDSILHAAQGNPKDLQNTTQAYLDAHYDPGTASAAAHLGQAVHWYLASKQIINHRFVPSPPEVNESYWFLNHGTGTDHETIRVLAYRIANEAWLKRQANGKVETAQATEYLQSRLVSWQQA